MRRRRVLRWATVALVAGASLVAIAVVVVTRTNFGADLALRIGLAQVHRLFDGQFAVGEIRTDNLLREVALYEVSITDMQGRPALSVDSIRIVYRAGDLIRQLIYIRDADVWGASVTISQLPGDERVNVERIFVPDRDTAGATEDEQPGPDASGQAGLEVRLAATRIHDAHVVVRVPAGTDPDTTTGVFEPLTDGEYQRRIEVAGLSVEVVDATLVDRRLDGERAEVRDMEGEVRLFPAPFRIEELAGELRRVGSRALVDARSLQIESSRFVGTGAVDWSGGGLDFEADLTSDGFDPADFTFFEPRLPAGTGRGSVRASTDDGRGVFALADAELAVNGSLLTGSLTVHTGDEIRLEGVDLGMEPLELALLEPWMDDPPPPYLAVRGRMRADGPLDRLELAGRVTVEALDRRHGPSTVELSGAVAATPPFAAYGLSAQATPLDFDFVRTLWAPFPIEGRGSVEGNFDGRLDRGLEVDATLIHRLSPAETSRVRYAGSLVVPPSGPPVLDGRAELLGLHLPTLAGVHSMFEAEEVVSGTIELRGPMDALRVEADLQSSLGDLQGSVEADATDPGSGARVDVSLTAFDPSPFLDLEADASLSGHVRADLARDSDGGWRGEAEATLRPSRYDRWVVDSLRAPVTVEDGYITITSGLAEVAGVRLDASGTVALDSMRAPGTLAVDVLAASLTEAWEAVVDAPPDSTEDALGPDDAGFDEEAAPAEESLEGRARGRIRLISALPRIDLSGELDLLEIRHELGAVDSARFEIEGHDVTTEGRAVRVNGDLTSSRVLGADFDLAALDLAYGADSLAFDASLSRADSVRHDVEGALTFSAEQTHLRLDRLDLRTPDVDAALARPARLSWGSGGFSVDSLELVEANGTDRSLSAAGTVPTEGLIDLRARADGIHLEGLSALWMRDDSLSGVVEGQIRFHGPVEAPSLAAHVLIRDFAYRSTIADSVRVDLEQGNGVAVVRAAAAREGVTVLDGDLRVPLYLAPNHEGPRVPEEPLEGRVTARGFPLAPLLYSPGFAEDIAGTLEGEVAVEGTPRSPRLAGGVEVRDASALFPEFGVRQEARGTLTLDGSTVAVDVSVRSVGRSRITGSVGLEDVANPSFDLRIAADTFQILNRRDVSGRVSGEAVFGGNWQSPRLEGALAIRNADLRLDELARSRQVDFVSESDFYQVVDTTIFTDRSLTTPSFADRSTIALDLTLGGSTWLRSRNLDTELAGRLRVTHEPGAGYGVRGELRTVRGSYRGFGRTFQVVDGSVLFAGTESLNPVLNITTVTRIRSSEQALDIFATLEGTAEEPRVRLSSAAEPPMAEEELVSYLVFGRPSYQLGSGENAVVSGVTGAASSMALGLMANELGSALGQEIGIFDYFTISAPQEAASYGQSEALRSSISATQVEFGQYLSENLFLAAVFRPLDSANAFAGGRLEWRFRDGAALELFLEDRLARSPSATFGDLGFTLEQSLGMFLAKEWTY